MSFKLAAAWLFLSVSTAALAQAEDAPPAEDSEELEIAAVEALIAAPPGRALGIVTRVLQGEGSDELKERALFVLGQIDLPEAQALLVETARSADRRLGHEAIRMIGIGGNPDALAALSELYTGGDRETKEAVLEAWLIADDAEAVYQAATNAQGPEEFEAAVETLAAMGAREKLRALRNRADMSGSLIDAYAVAGDTETLREIALDGSNPERQAQAISGLGIAGGRDVPEILLGIYRNTDSPDVKGAVRESLLIGGWDEAVLQLFHESQDSAEKRELLETLIHMDSEAAWDIIDATLENGQ